MGKTGAVRPEAACDNRALSIGCLLTASFISALCYTPKYFALASKSDLFTVVIGLLHM